MVAGIKHQQMIDAAIQVPFVNKSLIVRDRLHSCAVHAQAKNNE